MIRISQLKLPVTHTEEQLKRKACQRTADTGRSDPAL